MTTLRGGHTPRIRPAAAARGGPRGTGEGRPPGQPDPGHPGRHPGRPPHRDHRRRHHPHPVRHDPPAPPLDGLRRLRPVPGPAEPGKRPPPATTAATPNQLLSRTTCTKRRRIRHAMVWGGAFLTLTLAGTLAERWRETSPRPLGSGDCLGTRYRPLRAPSMPRVCAGAVASARADSAIRTRGRWSHRLITRDEWYGYGYGASGSGRAPRCGGPAVRRRLAVDTAEEPPSSSHASSGPSGRSAAAPYRDSSAAMSALAVIGGPS